MKVLSIEIGVDITHVLEIEGEVRNPKIHSFFSFATPIGMVGDGVVKRNEEFKKSLQKGIVNQKIKTRKVIFSITSGKIANREIEIPFVKENRIKELLNANSAEYFPVDLSQYQLVYRTIQNPELEKEKKRKLFVLAVPNDLVHSYEELSTYCGLELVALEYTGNAIMQTMRRAASVNRSFSVKIDEDSAIITIINEGELEMQRTIFYGVSDADVLVEESGLLTAGGYESARELMEQKCLLNHRLDEKSQDDNEELARLKDEVTESLRPLIGNIIRVIDYYTSRSAGVELKSCTLIGNAAKIQGLTELLGNELAMEVLPLNDGRSKINNLPKSIEIEKYIVCYGAVLSPLKFTFGEKQAEEVQKAKQKKEMMMAKVFCLICAIASVAMIVYAISAHVYLKSSIKSLNDQSNKLSYIHDIFHSYEAAKTEYADVVALGDATGTTSNKLADVIGQLEQSLPSGVTVASLTSNDSGVTLDMTVSTKPQAAKVIEELRKFDAFREVKTDGITETKDETGITTVSLKVTCLYVGGTADKEAAAAAGTATPSATTTAPAAKTVTSAATKATPGTTTAPAGTTAGGEGTANGK